jgi:glycosyltransferase involved in cell wall biosynthesis
MNPCLTEAELAEARIGAASKVLDEPVHLLFVGRVEEAKGIDLTLQTAAALRDTNIRFVMDIVGDGPARPRFELGCAKRGLDNLVHWHGWKPRPELGKLYAQAHFLLLPTSSEGLPKVIGEAMSYGVVPLAGAVSSIPQILAETGSGMALPSADSHPYSQAVLSYLSEPDRWRRESQAGAAAASAFTYDRHIDKVRNLFSEK